MEEAVNDVAKALKDYLVKASMGSEANSEHLGVANLHHRTFLLRRKLQYHRLHRVVAEGLQGGGLAFPWP